MTGAGIAVHQLFLGRGDGVAHAGAQGDGGDRLIARGEPLRHGHDVGVQTVGEASEPFAGAAEAGDHFIRMQKNIMSLQDA